MSATELSSNSDTVSNAAVGGDLQNKMHDGLFLAAHSHPTDNLAQLNQTAAKMTAAPQEQKLIGRLDHLNIDAKSVKQGSSEFVSSLSAGVVGTVALSVGAAYMTHNVRALTIPLALAAGAVTKYGVKDAAEHLLLDKKDRTLSSKDLLWGSVDAMAGIGASAAESAVAKKIMTNVGRNVLGGDVAATTAFDAGKMISKESLFWGGQSNVARGLVGGVTGAGIWSTPHRLAENWQEIKAHPRSGLFTTGTEVAGDIALGGAIGGALGLGGTLVARHQEIAGKAKASLFPDKNVFKLNTYHVNDFHSNTEQLPRLKTLLDAQMHLSEMRGVPARFVIPGDIESGRVNFAYTRGGEVENRALIEMGAKEIVPGNHPYDAPGGRADVPRYPAMMEPILQDHPEVSLISANLDVSAYPQYSRILKPYALRDIDTPWGKTKMGTVGLTTDEGALGQIKWQDPLPTAMAAIEKMKAEGATVFQIHSHLGLGEDIKLAQGLIKNNVKVSGIIGAHSHDALPTPYWVEGKIPIVQAGHS
ncbi:MAG: hypothetical protein KGS72_07440, partial [Cyanobacteria bacterium REEB67]|nr:hypothetical protein [Cyanobacteria bacterium REEB67]